MKNTRIGEAILIFVIILFNLGCNSLRYTEEVNNQAKLLIDLDGSGSRYTLTIRNESEFPAILDGNNLTPVLLIELDSLSGSVPKLPPTQPGSLKQNRYELRGGESFQITFNPYRVSAVIQDYSNVRMRARYITSPKYHLPRLGFWNGIVVSDWIPLPTRMQAEQWDAADASPPP